MKKIALFTACFLCWGFASAQTVNPPTIAKPGTGMVLNVNSKDDVANMARPDNQPTTRNTEDEVRLLQAGLPLDSTTIAAPARMYNEKVDKKKALTLENAKRKHHGLPPMR